MEKINVHTAMQYLYTDYPNWFLDMNFSLASEEEIISIIN
jgi:hypothetical protein